jgi:hypothetical protein
MMLYKFQCKKSADVLMLGDLTQKIFDIIGRPLEPKGVFLIEQLAEAIKKLEDAIALDEKARAAALQDSENDKIHAEKLPAFRLGQRVFPFLQLLKEALASKEMVIWGV